MLDKISLELNKEELDLLYLGIAELYLNERANQREDNLSMYEELMRKMLNFNINAIVQFSVLILVTVPNLALT